MSSIGNLWLARMRVAWLSVDMVIIPPGSNQPRTVPATVSATNRSVMDANGVFTSKQSRAFLISREDLPEEPIRGMKMSLTEGGRTLHYEAAPPTDGDVVWQWSDRTQTLRKIHATPVAG
jgi:hypothetical protein